VRAGQTGLVLREPVGVVGLIIPWNFPAFVFCHKVPFALAAGCTAVVKPSEFTSGTTLEMARLAAEAGVPPGVLNVVTGYGDPVGETIAKHPDVDFVSFTGSTATGRRVLRNAVETVKRVALELGGKGANIVFADADIDEALDGALTGICINQGEVCSAGSRLIIEERIAEPFLDRLSQAARRLKIGDPLDEATDIGALIHSEHAKKVENYIEIGRQQGAQVLPGGGRLEGAGYDTGCFVAPTILDRVGSEMTVFNEEIFGPVLTVSRFESEEEAVAIANGTRYGLANALWTRDLNRAMRVTRALKSGVVWVNTILEVQPQMPFGGVGESGFGREFGIAGLEEFTETKAVYLTGARDRVFLEA
jgi:acyl-CoA reductase-like NAD-dependent aldehyde dehydrogenase